MPYQLDGDFVGESEQIELTWEAQALSVVVPVTTPAPSGTRNRGPQLTGRWPTGAWSGHFSNHFSKRCAVGPCAGHRGAILPLSTSYTFLFLVDLTRERFHKRHTWPSLADS